MNARAWLLCCSALGIGCATSVDPGGPTVDSGKHSDSSVSFDSGTPGEDTSGPGADTSIPGIDTGSPKPDTGTKTDTASPGTDTSSGIDTTTPVFDTGTPGTDSRPTPTEGTTGRACTATGATCDTTLDGVQVCADGTFTSGPLYPTPVCMGINGPDCDLNDGTTIVLCDGDLGVCLASGTNQLCLPACSFDNTGAAPTGCIGKDACNVYGYGTDSAGKPIGVGYCFGGCKADGDCPTGSKCQIEDGLCVTSKVTYTKAAGSACTKAADAGTVPTCNCLYLTSTGKGYCANFCTVGSSTCASGYTCSPELPVTDSSGAAFFSTDPTGIAGYCLKNCTADSDCTAINAKCTTTASGKVCTLG